MPKRKKTRKGKETGRERERKKKMGREGIKKEKMKERGGKKEKIKVSQHDVRSCSFRRKLGLKGKKLQGHQIDGEKK